MYRFPHALSEDERADKICREHINNVLLYMINRHVRFIDDKNRKPPTPYISMDEVSTFFPHEYWNMQEDDEINAFITDKFLTLRAILMDKEDITPELLLEYVIAHMAEQEEIYSCYAFMEMLCQVVKDDDLQFEIHSMYDEYEMNKPIKVVYDVNRSITKVIDNIWNGNRNDSRLKEYYQNARLLIKEALDKANKVKGHKVFTKKEAFKFLKLISDGAVNKDDLNCYIIGDATDEGEFILKKYEKMFGHPAVYKLPAEDRDYVIEKILEDTTEIYSDIQVNQEEEIKPSEITERVAELVSEIEDTRTYAGSETIFWDWDYMTIDNIGTDAAIAFFKNTMGEDVGGIQY